MEYKGDWGGGGLYVKVNDVNPGPILFVLCCDGDFNWLGRVWGGGDLTPPWRSAD